MACGSSRYGRTFYLPKLQDRAVPLRRRERDVGPKGGGYDEAWLQNLLFETPEILPVGVFDREAAPATPLCRELPTAAGQIDLVYVSELGRLSIVECKLWRNPEARREVVVQILDYAKEISRWSYEELNAAVCRATGRPASAKALFDLVRAQHDTLVEAEFVDDVTRNLKEGRFVLMVVGDGIREEVERIADYLQRSAGIRFTLGLVELAIFDMPEVTGGGVIVEPRVLARTVEIKRAVVELADPDDRRVVVKEPPALESVDQRSRNDVGNRKRLTPEEFYQEIEQVDAALPSRLREFFRRYKDQGDEFRVTAKSASYILNWYRPDGTKVNFGTLFSNGELNTNYVVWNAEESGDPQVGVDYLEAVARLVPGARVKKDGNYWTWRVVVDGRKPKIAEVLKRSDEWLRAVGQAVVAFNGLDEDYED